MREYENMLPPHGVDRSYILEVVEHLGATGIQT